MSRGHVGEALTIGVDIGKYRLVAVGRWPKGACAPLAVPGGATADSTRGRAHPKKRGTANE